MIPARFRRVVNRFFRWSIKTPRRKAAWVLLVAYLVNQFVYPLIPFLKDNTVHANGVIEPVALGTSLFVNRNPDFNVWFGDRLDQSKHKIVFEVSGHEIELRLQGATESSPSGEIDELIANLKKELQKPYLTTTNGNDSIDQKIGDKATIRYEILPDRGVKESIIISEVAPTNQFVFSLKLSNGVQLKSKLENLNDTKLNASGSAATNYYFTDSKGKYLAHFEPLIMTDAAGAMSNDIKMEISDNTLTITANQDWLNSPDRVFPIDLDPTIVHDKNPDFSSGTENRTQVNSSSAVEGQFQELQTDINTVGLWHFNEGSSTTAYDASGNAKNGTLTNGPVWNGPTDTLVGLGKSNLSFDNADDYVAVGALTSSAVVKTVEFWTYPKSTSTEFVDLNASAYINVASGTIGTTGFTSPTVYVNGAVSSTLVANQWQHVAVTTETALNASATNFGKRSTSYLNGYLDEVRISNKARTPEEIAADASRFPYSVHESPVIDFGSTPNTLDSLNYSGTGIRTGDGETPYSRDGLIAQWNFNETSGTVAYNMAGSDSCGGTPSSCNLTLNNFASTSSQDQAAGTGWTANDKRWGAGSINVSSVATADTLSLSNPSTLDPNSADLSVETWVKTTDVTAELFSNNSANGVSCTSDGYYLGIDASGYPVFTLDTDGATAGCDATITSGITKKVNDGVWHHLAATVTRGSAAYLYMDGALIGSDTSITAYASEAPSGNVLVGSTNAFDGTLDALRFYARALATTEVLSNAQSANIEFQTRTGATATPNDGTWEAWKTTSGTGDTQIDAMDATTGWAWDGNTSDPTSVALDTTTKIEGTGSLKNIIGMPEADANTVALYHLEETSGTGAYIQDSSATNADGTPTGTTVVDGFYGKARSFNGSSDYIDVGTGPTSVKSVEFWVNPTTTTEYFVNLTSTTDYIWANAGTVTATGFTSPTIYVNGAVSSTIVAGQWQHIAVTSATAENASNLDIGRTADANYLEGKIDEVRFSDVARSADEIAEAYRAGRDHRVSKTISSTDLSAKTKLPFYVASDRPGTFLEATVGESAYANYEPDANTRGMWHLEEALDAASSIKDSGGLGNNLTLTAAPSFVQGKIGKARNFNGTTQYASCTDANCGGTTKLDYTGSGGWAVGAWIKPSSIGTDDLFIGKESAYWMGVGATAVSCSSGKLGFASTANAGSTWTCISSNTVPIANNWYYVVGTYDGTNVRLYINGVLESGPTAASAFSNSPGNFNIGGYNGAGTYEFPGVVDEALIAATAYSADEIRQAFEIGKRTHPITIDFKADLDSSNLITNTSDLSFAIQPDTDVTANSLNINKGEKIIVKENVNGTEYLAQGTVTGVTYESNTSNPNAWTQDSSSQGSVTTVTVTAWDSGSTVPSGGFTTAATVFKWQREYFDLTQIPLSTQRDAITRITLRVTDGSQGSNVWLDDFESADYSGGAITGSQSNSIAIGSTAQRYFQYRAILSLRGAASDAAISGGIATSAGGGLAMTSVTINYNSGTIPQSPKTKDASSDFSATGTSLNRITDTGSSNSPSLELAYKELPKDINTVALYHINESSWTVDCSTNTVLDSSGNAYHGKSCPTSTGPTTSTTAKLGGYAGYLDGSNDYVDLGRQLTGNANKTVEMWVYITAAPGAGAYIYSEGSIGASGYGMAILMNTTRTIGLEEGYGSGDLSLTSNTAVPLNTWTHVAITYNASTTVGQIFINGILDKSGSGGTHATYTASYNSNFGRYVVGNNQFWNGYIDEARFSNVVRSPEEIKYDAGRRPYGVYTSDVQNLGSKISSIDNIRWTENGVQTGDGETPYSTNSLVAQWNFNETSGTTAVSGGSCGSTCNGTVTSMTTTSQDVAAGDGWTKNNARWPSSANATAGNGAGALMFDGTDGHVTIPNSNTVSSVEMWLNPTSVASINIMQLTATATVTTSATGLITAGAGFTSPTIYLNGSTSDLILKAGVWNHVVVSSATGISTSTGYLGRVSTSYFKGVMDAVKLYNRALTATEILSNAQSGNVELQTRTGTTTTPNDGTWEEWRPSGNSTEVQLDNLQTLSPVQKINSANLVGYWKLDEVSGNRADSVGSNTLTDNATVTSKAGHLNLAGQFTAANSEYLSIADNTALSIGSGVTVTVSAWVYLDSKSANRPILVKDTSNVDVEYELAYSVGSDRFIWRVTNTADSWDATATANTLGSPNTGTWYHVLGYYDSSKIGISINNGPVDTTSYSSGIRDAGGSFEIGRGSPTPYPYFDGRIDEVAMWKRVLTADERKTLYEDGLDKTNDSIVGGINRTIDTTTKIEGTGSEKLTVGAPQVDSSTVGAWHLDETSGSGAYIKDATANAYNGTPSGTTLVDGFYSKGRSFNGTSDKIYGTPTSFPSGSNDRTVEAWVKTTQATEGYFFGYGTMSSTQGISFGVINSGKLVLTQVGANIQSTASINDNKWHHVAFTQTGSTQKMYIDGAQDGSGSMTVSTVLGANNWNIGMGIDGGAYFSGSVDEVKIDNVVRTADEIAEAYRAGRDHRLSKTITSTDLSAKTKLPFYVAADRPGTFLEATIGESAFANYEPDANTVGLWHLEENSNGSAAVTRKDSSGYGNNLTDSNTTPSSNGKVGRGGLFTSANSEYLSIADNSSLSLEGTSFTISAWVNIASSCTAGNTILSKYTAGSGREYQILTTTDDGPCRFEFYTNTGYVSSALTSAPAANQWYFVVARWDGANRCLSINGGSLECNADSTGAATGTNQLVIGAATSGASNYWNGNIDEIRIDKVARSADEIRQAYEIGKRTHQITNDFVTTPQASYTSGTSVTINNPYGTTNLTDTLNIGDTIIFKENVNGTETVSQSVVTNIVNTSSVYGTVTLLAAPTFPSGGYTTNATVFKWQREFMDISQIRPTGHIDAINRITLRVTDGSQGANVWIDDLKAAGPYLTTSNTRTASITSTPRQYMQYRIIFSTSDPSVSPSVTSVSVQSHSSPVKVIGSDTLGADGSFDKDGNLHLGSNNVKKVAFYDRTKDQISYALDFDNSNDYVAVGTGPTSVKTVEFWVNLNSTSTEFIDLNGSAYINVSSGTIGTTGFTSPTIYVNGSASTTLSANQWSHVAVTTATGLNATALNFGKRSTSYFNGQMDEVALYSSALTAAQVTTDYNIRRLAGTETGLVALYHFDEGQGTRAYDSIGGFHGTLTNMAATAWVNSQNDRDQSALSVQTLGIDPNWGNGVSRESYAMNFDGTGDYLSLADSTDWEFGSGDLTIDYWINPSDGGAFWINQYQSTSNWWAFGLSTILMNYQSNQINYNIATISLSTNQWYHISYVKSGTTLSGYIDGVFQGSVTIPTVPNPAVSLLISGDGTNFVSYNGKIDELRISKGVVRWSANFTPSRRVAEDSNTQLLLHFDEGTGSPADAASGGKTVTVNGNPTWVTDARAVMDNNSRYISLGSSTSANTDKGMEIYAISTTQFKYRWTGDQTWSSAVNFSSYPFATPAQLGTTGVYVGFDTTNGVFGDESYFLIPSWAIQQFSSTRGVRRSFPERSYLVATDRSVDIIDADDNTLWMRTTNGVTNNLLGTQTLNVPSSVFMVHGQLVVGTNGTAGTGVYRLDFNRDVAYRYNVTNRTTGTNNLAKRNATDWSWGSADTGQNLIDSIVNDVSLLISNGRLVMATANNTGLTKIANIMSNDTSYDYSDVTSNAYNRVKLGENYLSGTGAVGDMYALNSTNNALERWNNVVADAASETNGTPDATVNATSTPALFASAQTVNDLDIKTGTSLANSGNNTVFVGHNGGTTTFQENRATLASSSVKYYTKDYIGEEMVGDIRGSWPLQDVNDYSVKANTLTNNGTVTFATGGARGKAASFNGTTQYLSCTDASCGGTSKLDYTGSGGWSVGAWIKPTSIGTDDLFIGKGQSYWMNIGATAISCTAGKIGFSSSANAGSSWTCVSSATTPTAGNWYFVVATYDATNMRLYVNGSLDGGPTAASAFSNSTDIFAIGGYNGAGTYEFPGLIDEAFVTAGTLTATQIQQLYVAGKEALNNKYRVKLASDTVNQLAGSINVVKGVAASDQYIFAGTNTTGADDGILSRVLLRGDVTDRTYDESTTDPVIVDNDINSVAVSKDGAYIVVGTDDQGITIIHNGVAGNRLRSGAKVQGPSKRPSN